eukprot:10003436-Alexandrium_andersonii.AAC.1
MRVDARVASEGAPGACARCMAPAAGSGRRRMGRRAVGRGASETGGWGRPGPALARVEEAPVAPSSW